MEPSKQGIARLAFSLDHLTFDDDPKSPPRLVGHAAVFNVESQVAPWFRAKVEPGAFAKSIERDDIRALFNHDSNIVLGRKANKTLVLAEDDKGLTVDIRPPDTQFIRDMVMAPIKRGDISQMSIGFVAKAEEWDESGEMPVWILKEIELFEVSPVTFPAFPTTDIAARFAAWRDVRKLAQLAASGGLNTTNTAALIRGKKTAAYRHL